MLKYDTETHVHTQAQYFKPFNIYSTCWDAKNEAMDRSCASRDFRRFN